MGDSTVDIGLLLPDVLGTYSDAGNATVLAQRLRWRGIDARLHRVTAGDTPPSGCEIYVIGGGEDTAQHFAATWLGRHARLRDALANRAVTLAVCAGLQLLGHRMRDRSGHDYAGLGLLDLTTTPGPTRAVGETVAWSPLPGIGLLTGFVNHAGASTLGPQAWALGHVEAGPANDPQQGFEGALNVDPGTPESRAFAVGGPAVVGTYLHGPVLARNPALADHLLHRVVGPRLPEIDAERLPDLTTVRATYLPRRHRGSVHRRHPGEGSADESPVRQ